MAERLRRRPPISILGTGALAMHFGARLARAGHRVTLLGGWAAGLERLVSRGIEVEEPEGSWRESVEALALDQAGRLEPAPLILVLVKGAATEVVAEVVGRVAQRDALVATLQNGLGHAECLSGGSGIPVVAGATTAAARVLGPGRVQAVATGETVLPRAAAPLARVLEEAGFATTVVHDIAPSLWLKLAVNCAINPASALARCTNGELLASEELRAGLRSAAREVAAVAAAEGVNLPGDVGEIALDVARRTAGNRSSMLQDLERGAATEIDCLCGEVVRRGRVGGVATPVNESLLRQVLAAEREATRQAAVGDAA